MTFHPDVLAAHAEFGGNLEAMQALYDRPDHIARIAALKAENERLTRERSISINDPSEIQSANIRADLAEDRVKVLEAELAALREGREQRLSVDEIERIILATEPSDLSDRGDRVWTRRMAVAIAGRLHPAPQTDASGVRVTLTLGALQAAHVERQEEWCPDQKPDLSFRGNEMAGEVGEACNVIKKLERERHGWRGSRATKEQLAEELADVVHTAVLCAITAGISLEPAVIDKFNSTSEKNGLVSRLSALQPDESADLTVAHAVGEEENQSVTLTYRNWRGEVAERTIVPKRVWFGSTDWHPEPQWLLTAFDVEKHADRDFALKNFGAARPSEIKRLREALLQCRDRAEIGGRRIETAMDACEDISEIATCALPPEGWQVTTRPSERAVTEGEGCTSVNLVFSEGILRVNKDGSGYILVSEHDFELETEYDDDGNRSDFWITRFPSGEMKELKDFLNKVLASA